ncbi:MAG: DUF3124 domain-containing protein [Candidatus Obscuribacterales bacterium]|nr:DUF3124 domain-containing protein [Candidatus Obscuribacterales bacterium]
MKFRITSCGLQKLTLSALISILLLSACQPNSTNSPHAEKPDAWQLHLSPVNLPEDSPLAIHETIYLPVYAHIYYSDHKRLLNLAETVSIRNTDLKESIILTSVRHYRTDGSLINEHIEKPLLLKSLATADFVVPENDVSGGTGANFIIEWVSKVKVSEPITESIMIFAGTSHSVSFLSRGVVLHREENLHYKPASRVSPSMDNSHQSQMPTKP